MQIPRMTDEFLKEIRSALNGIIEQYLQIHAVNQRKTDVQDRTNDSIDIMELIHQPQHAELLNRYVKEHDVPVGEFSLTNTLAN